MNADEIPARAVHILEQVTAGQQAKGDAGAVEELEKLKETDPKAAADLGEILLRAAINRM
ncbi:hypothetical protein ACFWYW_58535 [Nonomuraea sp. NPDC059023]|uniref:hypothetical protein n=1 Tax=unclassified Nonomuraea TaxID=2593643 RepID=UPI0036ABA3EB